MNHSLLRFRPQQVHRQSLQIVGTRARCPRNTSAKFLVLFTKALAASPALVYGRARVPRNNCLITYVTTCRLGAILVCTSTLFGACTWAQVSRAEKSEAEKASAESLFAEARQLMKSGSFASACPKLAASQRLDPALGTLLNLALCYEQNGQTARAWLAYREAAGLAHTSGERNRETLALDAAALLAPRVPKLTIRVDPNQADVTILCDGQILAPAVFGTPVPVDPGEHVISASVSGQNAYSRRVSSLPGQSVEIDIPRLDAEKSSKRISTKGAVSSVRVQPLSRDLTLRSTSASQSLDVADYAQLRRSVQVERTVGWSLEAVGLFGVAAGTALAIYGKHPYDKGNCDPQGLCASPADYDYRRDGLTQTSVATVGFSVGLTALVVGTLLLWTAPRDRRVSASGMRSRATLGKQATIGSMTKIQ